MELDDPPHVEELEAQDPRAASAEQEQKFDEPEILSEEAATTEAEAALGEPSASIEDLRPESRDISQPEPEEVAEPEVEVSPSAIEPTDVEPQRNVENGDNTLTMDVVDAPVEDSQPPAAPDDANIPTKPVSIMDSELSDGPQNEEHGEQSDERRVSFAPGTPEPKPTSRKKKPLKGTKGKKKRNAVPMNEIPPDILAMIDISMGSPPPPTPELPTEGDAPAGDEVFIGAEVPTEGGGSGNPPVAEEEVEDPSPEQDSNLDQSSAAPPEHETLPAADEKSDEPAPEEQTASDEPLPADLATTNAVAETTDPPQSPQEDGTPQDPPASTEEAGAAVVAEAPKEDSIFTFSIPPVAEELAFEKPSKKKGSKSGRDKSKKVGSKGVSKQLPPLPAGLGIDIGDPTLLDIDDLLKDIPLPDGHVAAPPEDSKDVEAVSEEHDPPSAPEADASGDDPGEIQHEMDVKIEKAESKSSEIPMDEPNADKEGLNTVDGDAEAIMSAEDQPAADKPATADPGSSPADSGVEFEDIDKNIEVDDSPKVVEGQSIESLDEDEEEELVGAHGSPPFEDEAPKDENLDTETEQTLDEDAADTKGGPSDDEDGDTSELIPEDMSEEQLPVETDSTVDGEAPADPTSDETAVKEVETESLEPKTKEDGTIDDAVEGEDNIVDEEIQSQEPGIKGHDASPSDDKPDEPEPDDHLDESKSPESESVACGPTVSEPDMVSEEPSAPETDAILEDFEGAAPEPEALLEEVVPEGAMPAGEDVLVDAPALEDSAPADGEPNVEAPPSPNLSKTSSSGSRKHKTDHWERKHADNNLKSAFEDSVVLQKSKKGGKEEVRVKDRARKSRHTSSTEEDEARRRRRVLRKEEEARRAVEEEQRRFDEDKARRIRQDERRAARKADEEVEEKIKRLNEEKESIRRQREDEAKRRRHRERDREAPSPRKEAKDPGPALKLPSLPLPKALGFANGQSYHGKSTRYAEDVAAPAPSRHKDEAPSPELPKESSKDTARPSSSSGSKSHHRRHHSHRSEGERSSRSHGDSEHRSRRPPKVEEKPSKTLFGLLRRR